VVVYTEEIYMVVADTYPIGDVSVIFPCIVIVDALIFDDCIEGIVKAFDRVNVFALMLLIMRLPFGFCIFVEPSRNCVSVGAEIVL
jgi:hypothetical protein